MPFFTDDKNFQSQLNYELRIGRMQNVTFNLQRVNLPGLSLGQIPIHTKLNRHFVPGDEVTYQPLEFEFRVQEGMNDWYEIYQWIVALGFPDGFDRFSDLRKGRVKGLNGKPVPLIDAVPLTYLKNIFSDITLTILTSKENPYLEVTFRNAFPVFLSDLTFNSTDSDVNYISATSRFCYDRYDISKP